MPSQNQTAQLSFQICPILLTGGMASNVAGGVLPMMHLMGPGGSQLPLPGGSNLPLPYSSNSLDDAFAAFNVLPGGTLISQTIAKYPFANQYVAANAVIVEPLTLSVIMDTPMRGPKAWAQKSAVMTNLKSVLERHNLVGGMYTVVTPAYMYQNLVMVSLTDNSRGNSSLPQNAWRFDFERPLVVQQDLQSSYNNLMTKINNGTQTDGSQTGIQSVTGDTGPTPITPIQTIDYTKGTMQVIDYTQTSPSTVTGSPVTGVS